MQDDAGWTRAGVYGVSLGEWSPRNSRGADRKGKELARSGLLSQMVQIVGPQLAVSVVSAGPTVWIALSIVFLASGLLAPVITAKD